MNVPTLESISPNFNVVQTHNARIWFSYRTMVAFQIENGNLFVRENEWGATTGKHLNAIDGGKKETRLDAKTFLEKWEVFGQLIFNTDV